MTRFQKKLSLGLLIMALISPLGILIPKIFNSEGAWGEWGADELHKLLGYLPEGIRKYTGLWKAPIQDYNLGGENTPLGTQVVSYIISALLGICLVGLVVFIVSKFLVKHEK